LLEEEIVKVFNKRATQFITTALKLKENILITGVKLSTYSDAGIMLTTPISINACNNITTKRED